MKKLLFVFLPLFVFCSGPSKQVALPEHLGGLDRQEDFPEHPGALVAIVSAQNEHTQTSQQNARDAQGEFSADRDDFNAAVAVLSQRRLSTLIGGMYCTTVAGCNQQIDKLKNDISLFPNDGKNSKRNQALLHVLTIQNYLTEHCSGDISLCPSEDTTE